MIGLGRTATAFSLMAVLSGVTTLLSREAACAEPTTPECLTAYEDSVTLTKNHQLGATLAKLALCSSESCPAQIRTECLARASETQASIPTVVFEAKDAAGAELFEVKVKMDGDLLAEKLLGAALSVDPGQHTFTFETVGRPIVEKKLLILEGEKLRRERVDFETVAVAAPLVAAPVSLSKPEALVQTEKPPGAKPNLGKTRTLALVLGGVGVVATGVGVAYGLITKSRRDEANNICPAQCADQNGVDAWNRALSAGNISTGAFVIGAAGIASGVAIWLFAKPAADGTPGSQIGLGPDGFQLRGSW
jgi:hypothetical protein